MNGGAVERRVLLVVDAHVGRRGELRRMLLRSPVTMVHAEDPPDAVLRLEEAKPDLVVVAGEDQAAANQTLALLTGTAHGLGAVVYVADPRQRGSWPAVDGVLPLPLTAAALDGAWRDVTARRAADFAARAMELSLDTFASSEATPMAAALDPDTGPTPSGERAATRPDNTNVGDEPAGLQDVRAQASSAAADEDVFASGPAAVPPSSPPAVENEPTDATRTAPTREQLASSDDDDARTLVPPVLPRLTAAARLASMSGGPQPRVARLDAPIPARTVELSTSPVAGQAGVRVMDATGLGEVLGARLLRLHRVLDVAHHYDLLGVGRRASAGEITQAFQQLSVDLHPDRLSAVHNATARDVARTVYQRVTEAYRTLRDPTTRAHYDQVLEGKRAAPEPFVEVPAATGNGEEASTFKAAGTGLAPAHPAVMAEPLIRRDTVPQVQVMADDDSGPVRPAAQPGATPATRAAAAVARAPAAKPRAPVAAPVPAAPLGDLPQLTEDTATTAGGKKFMRLAAQAMARQDLNGARLNLTFALGYEPDNAQLKKRLADVEARLPRVGSR